ncbi:MAG: hypothetical protein H6605_09575 [Flavobacteriales bacterium]|nr:hypothetical protein [Flavobacteriales bacterium]
MVEKISKVLRVFAALSLLFLSGLLLLWLFIFRAEYTLKFVISGGIILVLVALFINYAILLIKNTFRRNLQIPANEILDEDEIKIKE